MSSLENFKSVRGECSTCCNTPPGCHGRLVNFQGFPFDFYSSKVKYKYLRGPTTYCFDIHGNISVMTDRAVLMVFLF